MIDLHFKIDWSCEAVPYAATPQLAFKLHIDAAEECKSGPIQVGHAARANPHRADPAELSDRVHPGPFRFVWRARAVGRDDAELSLDACQSARAVVCRLDVGRRADRVHVRFQRRRDEVLFVLGRRRMRRCVSCSAAPVFIRPIRDCRPGRFRGSAKPAFACRRRRGKR